MQGTVLTRQTSAPKPTIPFLRHIAWHSSTVLDRHAEEEQAKLFRRQSSRVFLSKRPMTAAFTLSWIRALSFTVGVLLLVGLRLWDSPSVREVCSHNARRTPDCLALRDRGATQLSSTGLAAFGVSMTQTIKHGRVLSTPSIYAGPCHMTARNRQRASSSRTARTPTRGMASCIPPRQLPCATRP